MTTNSGIKLTFETELDVAYDSDKEGIGCVRHEGDKEFIWLKGVGSNGRGYISVYWPTDYQATLITNTASPAALVGISCSDAAAASYGWFQRRGNVTTGDGWGMYVAKRATGSLGMASCATSGMIDNSSTAAQMIVLGIGCGGLTTDPTAGNGVTVAGWCHYPQCVTGGID